MTASPPDSSFEARLQAFPERRIAIAGQAGRFVGYRMAVPEPSAGTPAHALPIVLLHGIGSGSASWLQQLEALGRQRAVYAWDAPGYGASAPVAAASPIGADYARVLANWMTALGLQRAIVVGHSLGAIIGGALAAAEPQRVAGLLLISPAGGYGKAAPHEREQKRDNRLAMLAELGPAGLAEKRSANMLSAHASVAARDWVRWNMSRVVPHGYAQATHLLANADLPSDLAGYTGPVAVAVGDEDTITPPAACERIAEAACVPLQRIAQAGHAGYIEAPQAYTALIDGFSAKTATQAATQAAAHGNAQ